MIQIELNWMELNWNDPNWIELKSNNLTSFFLLSFIIRMSSEVDSLLSSLSIVSTSFSHSQVKTVEEWRPFIELHFASLSPPLSPLPTKSLFFKDKKDTYYLLVALADSAMDLKHLTKTLGLASGSLRFGPAEALKELLQAEQGAGKMGSFPFSFFSSS